MRRASSRIECYQLATEQLEKMQNAIDRDNREAFMAALDSYEPKDTLMNLADDTMAMTYIRLLSEALHKWLMIWPGFDKKR